MDPQTAPRSDRVVITRALTGVLTDPSQHKAPDNPVEKVERFFSAMDELSVLPECECFDTGIVRSIALYEQVGILRPPSHVSFVMGVASGMPAKAAWLPLLIDELPRGAHFQTIL